MNSSYTPSRGNDAEPNNVIEKAQPLSYYGSLAKGFITWSDDVDIYKLNVPKTSNVSFELLSNINEIYFSVLESNGITEIHRLDLYSGSDTNPAKWSDCLNLQRGTYYFKIKKYANFTGNYSLKIKDTVPPAAPRINAIKSTSKIISGNSEPYSAVRIYTTKGIIKKILVNKMGKFFINIKPFKPNTILYFYANDSAGNYSSVTKVIVKK